jgi:hypothetical protein
MKAEKNQFDEVLWRGQATDDKKEANKEENE